MMARHMNAEICELFYRLHAAWNTKLMRVLNKRTIDIEDIDGAVYIGRPSKWGNPFEIGKDGTRDQVIAKYEKYLLTNRHLFDSLGELKGRNLVCWCSPLACHGDVLLRYANK